MTLDSTISQHGSFTQTSSSRGKKENTPFDSQSKRRRTISSTFGQINRANVPSYNDDKDDDLVEGWQSPMKTFRYSHTYDRDDQGPATTP